MIKSRFLHGNSAALCLIAFSLLHFCSPIDLNAAFRVTDIEPLSGPIGTTVTLTGEDFDQYTGIGVTVNGTAATGISTTATTIEFTIAGGTTSGEIVVTSSTDEFRLGFPFEIKRILNGTFSPPANVSISGYEIGSGADFSNPDSGDGSFSTTVPLDFSGLVWAFRNGGDPLFLAVVTSADNSITIDATSTAKALAFLSPLLGTRDDAKTQDILALMNDLVETSTLAGIIDSNSDDGVDYLKTPGFDDALEDLVSTAVNPSIAMSLGFTPLAFESGTPDGTRLKEINPDYSTAIPATNVRLDSTLADVSPANPRDYILKIDTKEGNSNPADWAVQVWELSTFQFPSGFTSIDELDFNDTFDFFDDRPVATGFVGAQLDSANLDVVEILANKILDVLFAKSDDSFKPNEFLLPKDIPTIYVSQAFSGNLWYGTNFFFTPGPSGKSQSNVLDSDDPNSQWEFALASNIMIAAIDVVSVAVDLKDFVKKETLAGFMQSVFVDVSKAIQIMQSSEDGLNTDNIYIVVRKVAEGVLKAAISEATEAGVAESFSRLLSGVGKSLAKVFDVTGKVSAVEQSLERTAGFALPNALAVERSIVVIGDPFDPVIDSISPNEGQEGDTVTIRGRNFGFPLGFGEYENDPNEDITVSFCQFTMTSEDPENQTSDKKLAVPLSDLIGRTTTQIQVKVPQNFDAAFNSSFPVYACIDKSGKETSSRNLDEAGRFKLLDPPSILSVTPDTVLQGGYFTITGERFGDNSIAIIDGYLQIKPARVENSYMLVPIPSSSQISLSNGEHTVRVRRNMRESADTTFTLGYPDKAPTGGVPTSGWTIQVSVGGYSNIDDADISLLEAMLLANGDLGRPLGVHLACEEIPMGEMGYCGGQQPREVDNIFGYYDNENNPRPGGVGYRDYINVNNDVAGTILSVGSAGLPPVGNGDVLDLDNMILDGTNAPAGAHGLFLDNAVSNTYIEDVILRNWSGDGVRLGNQCQDNEFRDIVIEDVDGHGVSLFTDSSGNEFFNITVDGTGTDGDGFYLVGNSDHNDFIVYQISNTGRSGIRLEDGSSLNYFSNTLQSTTTNEDIDALVPKISNTGAHAIHLINGTMRNRFNYNYIDTTGSAGIFLENDAQENRFTVSVIKNAGTNGIHLSGSMVKFNGFQATTNTSGGSWGLEDIILNAGSYGIRIDSGANNNIVAPRRLFDAADGGILIDGDGTDSNYAGKFYPNNPGTDAYQAIPSLNYDSGGHGVHISGGAKNNTIQMMNISGHGDEENIGDGVRIEGDGTSGNHVSGIYTGFQYFVKGTGLEPFAQPNNGNSVHILDGASDNVIGGSSVARNNLSNDLMNAILIEGSSTSGNVVRDTQIGRTALLATFPREFAGTGMNGIAITDGAHDNFIGTTVTDTRVEIDGIVLGAGIFMDNAHDNTILGCFLGTPFEALDEMEEEANRNKIGIHLRNGSSGNRIGQPGPLIGGFVVGNFNNGQTLHDLNRIVETSEIGIWIEDSGGSIDQDGNRINANILQNNIVGSYGVGLKISGNSKVNDIGGFRQGSRGFILFSQYYTQDDNSFQGNEAGMVIEDVIINDPAERNLFANNFFSGKLVDPDDDLTTDVTTGPPPGVSLLITGTSEGNIIGEAFRHYNQFQSGSVGVYIDGADNNTISGNIIGGFVGNLNGVVIRNGQGNRIGGGSLQERNEFDSNGVVADQYGYGAPASNPNAGGIYIFEGQDNIIQNNEISNSGPQSIIIEDSSDNLIGGPSRIQGNQILDTTFSPSIIIMNGIVLRGSGTTNNVIQNNVIGITPTNVDRGVSQDGIDISDNASNNLIGGSNLVNVGSSTILVQAPNTIAYSDGHGIHVSGGGTTGNRILNNSIFANGGLGIENENSGNDELPPPVNMAYGDGGVTGEVEIATVPEGSIVNVYSDMGTQGEVFLGQTLVKAGGSWALTGSPPPAFNNITATVTHVNTGSTSEFALAGASRAFTIARTDAQAPSPQTIAFVDGKASVHFLTVEAVNDDVRVDGITLKAADDSTLIEDTALTGVSIYQDTNGDGEITEDDAMLAGPTAFDIDNGEAVIGLPGIVVEAGVPQQWIVRYEGDQSPPEGATFSLSVESALAVPAQFLFPFGADALAVGAFPIASNEFTIGEPAAGSNITDWKATHFPDISDDTIIGNDADPDHDGLTNLQEYALGTDPNVPNAQDRTQALVEGGVLVFEFKRVLGADDVTYTVEFSDDLVNWDPETGIIDSTEVTDNEDGTETVKVTTTLQADQVSSKFARLQVAVLQP